jgi:predicted ATP-grasp superfamily ATP-dependent carboligase
MKNNIQKKQKIKTDKDIQKFVNKAVDYYLEPLFGIGRDIADAMYEDDYIDEKLIESLSKKATKVSTMHMEFKNNKHFQKQIKKLMKVMSRDSIISIKRLKNQREKDKKRREAITINNAEKAIFAAGLTSEQKKALKKFLKVDLDATRL